jgi:hypothetical protein
MIVPTSCSRKTNEITTPKREAADAGVRDDAARRREAILARGAVDLAPRAAAADLDGPALRVDLDALEPGQVDDDAAVARAEPGAVVAAAADGERQPVVAGEADGLRDVVGAGAAGDQRRTLVDHRVVDLAGVVVARVVRSDQGASESPELAARRLAGGHQCAHASSSESVVLRRTSTLRHARRPVMTRADALSRPHRGSAGVRG